MIFIIFFPAPLNVSVDQTLTSDFIFFHLLLTVFFFSGLISPQFCHNNKKAQKYLLGGFECVVKLHQVQLLPRVPIILKDLYDADLLEEDVIFAWAEKVRVLECV